MRIAAAGWDVRMLPARGGAVASLRHDGKDILRHAVPGATGILDMASFPLVPYANRIAGGRFAFGGRPRQLALNFGDHPHSLHGLGWQAPWEVMTRDADRACMVHRHGGQADWPWPYIAGQEVRAGPDGVEFRLSMRNEGEEPMPVGLGFHPYFIARNDTRLVAELDTVWLSDAACIPTQSADANHFADWRNGAPVRHDALVDHCHSGWNGTARIEQPTDGLAILLSAGPELRHLHLYMPPGEDFFCAEPVSHMPDALNRTEPPAVTGLRVIEPGETMTAWMRIAVEAL